jgi:opacity protein-like surface antigen
LTLIYFSAARVSPTAKPLRPFGKTVNKESFVMLLKNLAIISFASLLSFKAIADDKGLYVGAGVSSVETDKKTLSDNETGYKVYTGYRMNDYFAFEGAIIDLGDFKDNNLKFEGRSAQLATHIGFPIGQRIRLFGSLGAHAWDADGNVEKDDTGVDLTYGAGVEMDVFRNFGLRAEYEVLEVGKIDINQTTASAYLRF